MNSGKLMFIFRHPSGFLATKRATEHARHRADVSIRCTSGNGEPELNLVCFVEAVRTTLLNERNVLLGSTKRNCRR